jgi:N12 class adenine-specific DNA methylase
MGSMKDYSKINASRPIGYVFVDKHLLLGQDLIEEKNILNATFVDKLKEIMKTHNLILMSCMCDNKKFDGIIDTLATINVIPDGFNNMDTEMDLSNEDSKIFSYQAVNLADEIADEELPEEAFIFVDIPIQEEKEMEEETSKEEETSEVETEEMEKSEEMETEVKTALDEKMDMIIEKFDALENKVFELEAKVS